MNKVADDTLRALEAAWNEGRESTTIEIEGIEVARVVALSNRGNKIVPSRDAIRGMSTIRRWLRNSDVIVTNAGIPRAVIISISEYERLTGRLVKREEP